jgi:DNA-directed RNA polymerase subunit E'/Rpb7
MKKRTVVTPIVVGAALIALMVVLAVTNIFQPLVQFVHTGEITLLQAFGCLVAAGAAFGLTLKLLIMLGGYFLPKAEQRRREDELKKE